MPELRRTGSLRQLIGAIAVTAAVLLAGVSGLEAQVSRTADAWRWVRFGKGSGLPSDRVDDLVEAADGTAWASTANGLAWYDGYQWTRVGVSRGLPDSLAASSLAPDGEHGMLAVFAHRLYRGDTSGFRPVVVERDGAPVEVTHAVALQGGDLLIAANGGALLRYTAGRLGAESLTPGAPAAMVQDLRRTSSGAIWIAARSGLYRWGGARWIRMSALAPDQLRVGEDAAGRWAAFILMPQSQRGLWESRGALAPARTAEGKEAVAYDIAPTGEMAIVNSTLELRWRSAPDAAWQDLWAPLQTGTVLSLRFRQNGDLWVGTTQGLYLFRRSARLWTDLAHKRFDSRNVVNEILRTRDGAIWLATENGVEVHPSRGPARSITEIGNSRLGLVTGLAEDDAGGVWVSSGASFEGAWRWDGAAWRHYGPRDGLYAPRVHKIRRDRQGRLWFLGIAGPSKSPSQTVREPGAFVYDRGRFTRWGIPEGLPGARVYAFGESTDGALWFGTEVGISRWKLGAWTHWRPKQRVFTLAVGLDNRVWFADQMNVLTFIDAHDQPHDVGTANGLNVTEIWDLRVDSAGWLWAATRSGLALYHDGAWSWIGPEQGLMSPRLWPVLPLEDRVYLGSTGGGVIVLARDEARGREPRVQIASAMDAGGRATARWSVRQYWGLPNADFMETRHRLDGGAWSRWSLERQLLVDGQSSGRHVVEVQAKGMLGDIGAPARQEFSVPLPLILRPVVAVPAGVALVGLMVLVGMMVTTKRRRDAALRESELRFRDITSTMGDRVWEVDAQGVYTYSSGMGDVLFGDVIGKSAFDFIRPDDATRVREAFLDSVARRSPIKDLENWNLAKNGEEICLLTNGVPILDAEGRLTGYRGVDKDITARKRLESDLRESIAQTRAISQSAHDAIISADGEGNIVSWNLGAEQIFDYAESEAIGMPFTMLMPEQLRARQADGLQALVADGAPGLIGRTVELEAARRDGTVFPVDLSLSRWQASAGWFYTGIIRDTTQRRKGMAALQESEERFRSIFNDAPLGVALVDSATARYSQVNPRFAAILGRTIEEMITLDWMRITHPDDLQKGDDDLALLKAGKIPGFTITKRYLRPDGTPVWCNATITRMTAGDVNRPQYLVMMEDISERVRSESVLRLESAALAAAANAIVITDRDGVIEWANAAFTTFSGYRVEEAIGSTPGQLLKSGIQDEAFYRAMWHTIQSGDVWRGEVVNKRKDGSLITEDMTITPLRNERREITHFIAVKQDISQAKALEEQLRQSQKMEAVGRLAGGVAHDFNNMLSVILGRAELVLLQTDASQPIHAHLLEIEEAAKRSANLTRQLLAFARRQTIMPEVLDLNKTVTDSLRMLQRLIGENIQLRWQPAPMLWPIRIDPSQMDQILANLCINVRDAIADVGTLVISTANSRIDEVFAATHANAVPGEYVLLTVSDTGCGMDAATLAQIFEPFFTTKDVGKGTGLGLSMVYGAIRQNGGYVTVASEPGRGTTFEIYLPRYVGKEGPEDASNADADIPRGDETILLVEDEPVVLDLTTEMLQAQGYTVLAASSPKAAIRLAEKHAGAIDLLLTDVIMPEMNGRELANKLVALLPGLRYLFMSGYSADIIGPHGVLDEETHFLGKPFSLAALAAAVRKALHVRVTPPGGGATVRGTDG
jgi:PAS domain S-box-containing protein